jgi:hypothetical protein
MARLAVDVHEDFKARVDGLKVKMTAPTLVEVLRRAVALLEVVTEAEEAGGRLEIHLPDGSVRQLLVF